MAEGGVLLALGGTHGHAEASPVGLKGVSYALFSVPPFLGVKCWFNTAPNHDRLAIFLPRYDNLPIYITENRFDIKGEAALTGDEALDDQARVGYLQDYLSEVGKAIRFDEVDVRGFWVWSLLDNFEWSEGFSSHFGLVHVDYTSPDKTRTPKMSFHAYADIIRRFRQPDAKADAKKKKGGA